MLKTVIVMSLLALCVSGLRLPKETMVSKKMGQESSMLQRSAEPGENLGEGECRRSDNSYPLGFSAGIYSGNVNDVCSEMANTLSAWVRYFQIDGNDCKLVTTDDLMEAAGVEVTNDNWGGKQTISEYPNNYFQTYRGGGGSFDKTVPLEPISVMSRPNYYCYQGFYSESEETGSDGGEETGSDGGEDSADSNSDGCSCLSSWTWGEGGAECAKTNYGCTNCDNAPMPWCMCADEKWTYCYRPNGEPKEPQEPKEPHDPKEPQEPKEPQDPKEPKEPKEPKGDDCASVCPEGCESEKDAEKEECADCAECHGIV